MESTGFTSPYIPNTDADRRKMLEAIGVDSVEDLFQDIPAEHRDPTLSLPPPLAELELWREVGDMARKNAVPGDYACFLGAGSYRHFVPAIVRQIVGRSEFMTSYTPYQPEVSQGTLQAEYEFQSLVCQLTGMEVANVGMYDGSSAMAEATLMAARLTGLGRVAVLHSVSPFYRQVLDTYVQATQLKVDTLRADQDGLAEGTACLIVQQPNFYGYMEDLARLSKAAHSRGALLIVSADPIALGMFRPPADLDADIVVGEGQSLGVSTAFGGPYVGLFASRQKYVRQMPGRIVGKTVDTLGRAGYTLTLQTREQHIRRERANSNICTSVGLMALMATVYLAAQGKRGLSHIAELCYHKAHYAASLIADLPGYSLPIDGTFFREFVVQCPRPPAEINERLLGYSILGGLDVSSAIPGGLLLCLTEMNSRQEIEALANALGEIGARA